MRRSVRSRTLAAFATCVLAAGSLATVSALVTAAPARALDLAGTPPALGSKYCFDSQEGVFRVPNGAQDVQITAIRQAGSPGYGDGWSPGVGGRGGEVEVVAPLCAGQILYA